MKRPTSLPLLPPWGVQSCFFCFLEVLLLLVKKNRNKIVHFKGWVVTESWGVQFCLVCFLINSLIARFTSFQDCTCLLSMKAMLLNKEENIDGLRKTGDAPGRRLEKCRLVFHFSICVPELCSSCVPFVFQLLLRSGCCCVPVVVPVAFPVAFRLRSGCVPVAFRLRSGCVPVVFRLRSGCVPVAFRLRSGCVPVAFRHAFRLRSGAFRLRSGCVPVAFRWFQLRSGCVPVAFRLRSVDVPVAFRLRSGMG